MDSTRPADRRGTLRLLAIAGLVAGVLLASFGLWEAFGPDRLADVGNWLTRPTVPVALASATVLAADVALPVPSSIVMTANGAVFGWAAGAAVSAIGATGAAAIAYVLGGRADAWVRARAGDAAYRRLAGLVARYGAAAVAATRPVPIVAELVALAAGSAHMPPSRFIAAAAAGAGAVSLAYALVGDAVVRLGAGPLVALGVLAVASALYFAGRHLTAEPDGADPTGAPARHRDAS